MHEKIIQKLNEFNVKWKYHNVYIILGTLFLFLSIGLFGFSIYEIFAYHGDNKFLCWILTLLMSFISKKISSNTLPSIEDHTQFLKDKLELKISISEFIKNEFLNSISRNKTNSMDNK